jgi:hypothetical protein
VTSRQIGVVVLVRVLIDINKTHSNRNCFIGGNKSVTSISTEDRDINKLPSRPKSANAIAVPKNKFYDDKNRHLFKQRQNHSRIWPFYSAKHGDPTQVRSLPHQTMDTKALLLQLEVIRERVSVNELR